MTMIRPLIDTTKLQIFVKKKNKKGKRIFKFLSFLEFLLIVELKLNETCPYFIALKFYDLYDLLGNTRNE